MANAAWSRCALRPGWRSLPRKSPWEGPNRTAYLLPLQIGAVQMQGPRESRTAEGFQAGSYRNEVTTSGAGLRGWRVECRIYPPREGRGSVFPAVSPALTCQSLAQPP